MNLGLAGATYQGYLQGQAQQDQVAYQQALHADQEAQMAAAQQTYQPLANARVAQAGLSQAQAQGQTSLVPGATQIGLTQQATQQSADSAALARQPTLNQTADDAAAVQAGAASTQRSLLPQTMGDTKIQQATQDQNVHVQALNGLYGAMIEGAPAAKAYVQKIADSGQYPGLVGKQVGQVGLTADGQNFVAQDAQGNEIFTLPVSSIQQAHSMAVPTEWKTVGDTLVGTQGGRVTQQYSAPKFTALKPGETGVVSQGTNVVNATQAPVPDAYAAAHQGVTVNTANWLMKNVPGIKAQDAFNMAKQANSMSREQFVATIMGNPMLNTSAGNPAQAAQRFGAIYDQLRTMNSAPGLSNAPGSNTSGNSIIDTLIGGANPSTTAANPFVPDQ